MGWRAYRTGLRRKTEPKAEYVNRFENLTRQLQSHGVKLDKREKAIAMVEMAQLTTAECVAVLCIAKFEEGVDDSDLDLRMKEAMRTIASNIMGKESAPETANAVLALEYENREQTLHDGGRLEGSTV